MHLENRFVPQPGELFFEEWVWCLHCERVHLRSQWEHLDLNCPSPDCDGGPFDAVPWEEVHTWHMGYPAKPIPGGRYSA